MSDRFRIYIGYDSREQVAYEVLKHSILRNTTTPLEIIPLKHAELRRKRLFMRPWLTESNTGNRIDLIDNKPFSTEFSHTRFLVPHLARYKGWALFLDCDMLFTGNIKEIIALCDDKYAMLVYKHRHAPQEKTKMDAQPQSEYRRKNWSSFILWNCGHHGNQFLTTDRVNTMKGSELHQLIWLDDKEIGDLPPEYNWIEGSSPVVPKPKVIHYSAGGPWFEELAGKDGAYFDLWERELHHYRQYGEDVIVGKGVK